MVRGWDDFREAHRIVQQHLEPVHVHCAHEKNVRMRAYGEVLSVHPPSRARHLPISGRDFFFFVKKKTTWLMNV